MQETIRKNRLLQTAAAAALLLAAACGQSSEYSASYSDPSAAGERGANESEAKIARLQAPKPQAILPAPAPLHENYADTEPNPVNVATEAPVSTFSIDVDTGAYSNMRRFLQDGRLPPADSVRIEELVNYFNYDYPQADNREQPFSVTTEVAPTPWNPDTKLLHIGIKAYDVPKTERPPANLVFLVDVSGSMQAKDKLPLLQSSLRLLVKNLTAEDRISLVTYAGATRVVLSATSGDEKQKILDAIEKLDAGGGTNGGAGIKLAYAEAARHFMDGAINRILLATDGDLNVGLTAVDEVRDLVEDNRERGVHLSVLGFGTGNLNDRLLEQMADHGNGNYAYIDSLLEAKKVLSDELSSTFLTVARDVKLQVEFNPAVVAEYRLIGYENRALKREDFNNDKVDAGEIGAGHTVTALYEIALAGSRGVKVDPLRYSDPAVIAADKDEMAFLKIRYKQPDGDDSKLMEFPVLSADIKDSLEDTHDRYRFSAAVAAFGQILRDGDHTGNMTLEDIEQLARTGLGPDPHGYRREFLKLVDLADGLSPDLQLGQVD